MRKLAAVGLLTCLALAAAAPRAGATIDITEWDAAAVSEPTGHEGVFIFPEGEAVTQAGAHPDVVGTSFSIATLITAADQELPTEFLRDGVVDVPPGLVGNPQAVPRCRMSEFSVISGEDCPPQTQIGVARLKNSRWWDRGEDVPWEKGTIQPLYNLVPPPGVPALLGFKVLGVPALVYPDLRSDGDYGVTLSSVDINQTSGYKEFSFEVWGVPADPSHDFLRSPCLVAGSHFEHYEGPAAGRFCPSPEAADPHAFLALPTSCVGPTRTDLTVRGWMGGEDHASVLSHDMAEPPNPAGNIGCDQLEFDPSLEARPTTNAADSPTGLSVDVHVPQASDQCDPGPPIDCPLATAHLRDATVTLAEGLAVNPSSANGLGACSSAQAGLLTPIGSKPIHLSAAGAHCPDDSKIGTVEVETPLLDHPARGAVYVAKPYDNPFDSLLAIYIAIDDPQSGTHATLAGEVHADPAGGRLSSTISENPQLPVEDVKVHLFEGPHAPLRTPATCGAYATTARLTPWSAANGGGGRVANLSDPYEISRGPGRNCAHSPAELPNSPDLDAGTVSPIAGRYSPLVVDLRREDGTQRFKTISLTPPPGLLAKLAGVEACPDAALAAAAARAGTAEQASPSCPRSSRVGTVYAAAGAGPSPYWAPGAAYLAGPYKGAPLSLAIVTPAVAGPFDLGTVVVRVALRVDPETTRITAVSDPLPEILQGIPLDVRAARVLLDRPQFTRNGTSCDPLVFSGLLISTLGQAAPLSERFQLGECARLAFKPKLSLRLKGGAERAENPKLIADLTAKEGEAGISAASVRLPRSAFLDQSHIRTICTRVQWAADACPKGAIYGRAWAKTPLLDYRLAGNVYLRSSSHKLPDLVVDLRGPASQPIRVDLVGRTDSLKGALRNSFEAVPDAPVSRFHLELFGGKRGLVINSRDVCARPYRASIVLRAHSGKVGNLHPLVHNDRCGPKRSSKRR